MSDERGPVGDLPPVPQSASAGERTLGGTPELGFGSGLAADGELRRPAVALDSQADDELTSGSESIRGSGNPHSLGSRSESGSDSELGGSSELSDAAGQSREAAELARELGGIDETGPAETHEATESGQPGVGGESEVGAAARSDAEIEAEGVEAELEDDEELEAEDEAEVEDVEPIELIDESAPAEAAERNWYILKVQVNREESIREALLRRVKLAGLEDQFGEVVVPTEDVVEFTKTGKKRVVKKKLYPGYIVVDMVLNDDSWFLVRETPGIGDFTGSAGKPTPMQPHEVARIIRRPDEEGAEGPKKMSIPFKPGNRVRVKEGYFQNFEGDVESIDEANGRVTVMINIFGRSTPVELEHWQVEAL